MVLALQAANDAAQVAQVAQWAWLFVALRVLYIVCYVADRATLRPIVWLLGVVVVIRLYALAF